MFLKTNEVYGPSQPEVSLLAISSAAMALRFVDLTVANRHILQRESELGNPFHEFITP